MLNIDLVATNAILCSRNNSFPFSLILNQYILYKGGFSEGCWTRRKCRIKRIILNEFDLVSTEGYKYTVEGPIKLHTLFSFFYKM